MRRVIATCLLLLGLVPRPVLAAGPAQSAPLVLSVSPVRLELAVDPGGRVVRHVTIANAGADSIAMHATVQDFEARGEDGRPRFLPARASAWSGSPWIGVTPRRFVLRPGERRRVRVRVDVPKRAEPGGRYAAVLFSTAPAAGGRTAVVGRLGTLLLLRVSGKAIETGRATLLVPRLVEPGPLTLSLRFANRGNVHVRPAGAVRVCRWPAGDVVAAPLLGGNVLPGSSRLCRARLPTPLRPGVYRVAATLRLSASGPRVRAPAVVLVVLPWRLVLTLAVAFLAGLGPGLALSHRRRGGPRDQGASMSS